MDALPTELCTGETLTDAALARVWSAPLRHEVQARRSHTLSVYHAQAGGGQPSRLFDGHAVREGVCLLPRQDCRSSAAVPGLTGGLIRCPACRSRWRSFDSLWRW